MRALLIEDDQQVAEALTEGLREYGWAVDHMACGLAALEADLAVDVVLLDLNLPDVDGLELCHRLRNTSDVPIIAVTARSAEMDRVLCLRLGADDYLVKPYGLQELLARMAAVLRRSAPRAGALPATDAPENTPPGVRGGQAGRPGTGADDTLLVMTHGPLVIDRLRRQASLYGRPIVLTRKEFDLLVCLAAAPERVLTRSQILEAVWGHRWFSTSRTLDTHVAALRRKLGDRTWIETVRGVGFRFISRTAS